MAKTVLGSDTPEDKINETLRLAKFEAERCLRSLAMDTADERKCYVYLICLPDGTSRYVGKGMGNRINAHRYQSKSHKNKKLAESYATYGKLPTNKIVDGLTHDEAFAVEEALIALYGMEIEGAGPLANLDGGGEGGSNRPRAVIEYTNAKIKAANKRKEVRDRHSAVAKKAWADPEKRERYMAGLNRAAKRQDVKDKRAASMAALYENEGFRERRAAAIKASKAKPEVRARHSASARAALARPDVKANHARAVKEAQNRPEVKAKRSAISKNTMAQNGMKERFIAYSAERNANPEFREYLSKKGKESWSDPTEKERRMAKIKAGIARYWAEKRAAKQANN